MVDKVVQILGHSPKTEKKGCFFFQVCEDCFGEMEKQLLLLLKTGNSKKFKRLGKSNSEAENLNGFEKLNMGASPFSKKLPTAMQRRFRKMFAGSFNSPMNMGDSGFSMYESRQGSGLRNNQLHQVPALDDLIKELESMNLSEQMMIGIAENVGFLSLSSS